MVRQTSFALITGCRSGIGKQLAISFAAQGVTVLATARCVEHLQELTSQYKNIEAFPLELGDSGSIERLRDAVTVRTGGRLDFLVNNAGTHYAATAMDLELEEAVKVFQVNVFSVMRLCQVFVPLLRRSHVGRIVQIGSVTRDVPVVWQCAYNASKAALSQYTKTLRLELAPFNIEVIEIVTGFVRSNILHHGLVAPEGSLYLPIKKRIETLKYQGNKNGMETEAYARSVVEKLMSKRTPSEIWEGNMARTIRFLVGFLPLHIPELALLPQIPTWLSMFCPETMNKFERSGWWEEDKRFWSSFEIYSTGRELEEESGNSAGCQRWQVECKMQL